MVKVQYEEAMENLKTMFGSVDPEVIHNVLTSHNGKIDPTIEDLLKLCDDTVSGDNLFSEKENYNNGDFGFRQNDQDEEYVRKLQEDEDMKLAMKLQQGYTDQARGSDMRGGYNGLAQYSNNMGNRHPQGMQGQGYQNQPQEFQSERNRQYQPNYNEQSQPYSNQPKKPKKSFGEKFKEAKTKFANMFKKKKKGDKEFKPSGMYAGIDDLDDHEVISFNNPRGDSGFNQLNSNPKDSAQNDFNDDLDDIPDPGANPYSNRNATINSYSKNDSPSPSPFQNRKNQNKSQRLDESDDEYNVEGDHEEAKHDFKLAQQTDYNQPTFNNAPKFYGDQIYPKFDQDQHIEEPDLKEYSDNKKTYNNQESLI